MTKQKEILTDSAPMELSPMLVAGVQGAAVKKKLLELFAGSRSVGKEAEAQGMEVLSVDWKDYDDVGLVINIADLKLSHLPYFIPDIVWASFDCTTYTIAAISTHRNGIYPKSEYAKQCDETNQHVISLIDQWLEINPNLIFFIENPRGMLRHMPWMKRFTRHTVWYCQYGDDRAKPTDIFTNSKTWIPKPECHNYKYDKDGNVINKHCHHASARRGAKTGTQGRNGSYERSKIPNALIKEILKSTSDSIYHCEWCEKELKNTAHTHEFLTGVFGYIYCSENCMLNHMDSK